jgi:DNA-binding NtrC family response regulator
VGEDRERRVDVRILAATHRDLEQMMDQGAFRRDLYERLAQAVLALPPLRDRPDDIPLLVARFLEDWNRQCGENRGFSDEAVRMLEAYPWPGNVRELQNAVIASCAVSQGTEVPADALPARVLSHLTGGRGGAPVRDFALPPEGIELRAVLHEIERHYYELALGRAGGSGEAAARLLGLKGPAFRKAARERFGLTLRGADTDQDTPAADT